MAEFIKETVTTRGNTINPVVSTDVRNDTTNYQTVVNIVYYLFGAIEIILAFRLIFKMMGASTTSGFVSMIYGLTGIFIAPFEGIFRRGFTQGIETTSVLEPSTLVAIIVYPVLAWGIVKLIRIFSGQKEQTD